MKKNYMKPESTWNYIGGAEELADGDMGNWGSKGVDGDAWTKEEKEGTDIWGKEKGSGIWDDPTSK